MMDANSHVCKKYSPKNSKNFFKLSHPFCFTGNDELVKALIFDAVVTKDFENQKSPRRGGKDMV